MGQGLQRKGPLNSGAVYDLMPPGENDGDMLYWDATAKLWKLVPAPDTEEMDADPVMRFSRSEKKPYWEEPEGC